MDDIVRKCLAAYKAITSSGGKVVNKIVIEEPIKEREKEQESPPQPEQQGKQKQYLYKDSRHTFERDIAEPNFNELGNRAEPGKQSIEVVIDDFQEIKFPIDKAGLIKLAKGDINEDYYRDLFNTLPTNKIYKSVASLEDAIVESLNKKNIYGPRKKVVGCKIYNDKNEGDVNRKQFKQSIREEGQEQLEEEQRELEEEKELEEAAVKHTIE
jgi:hypothetical protein